MAFVSLLVYITVIYLRPQEWVPAVYGWQLLDGLAILIAFCIFLTSSPSKRLILTATPNLLLLGFLITVVLSHLSHTYFWGAYNSFIEFSKIVIMFFLFVNVLTTERKIKISLWLIIILTVLIAIQGIHQYQTGIGWAGQLLSNDGRIRWVGIFNDANDLALALAMAIGLLLAFIFGKTKIFMKILIIPMLAILLRALYLTNSRGGYLALAATIAFYLLTKFKNKIVAGSLGIIFIIPFIIFGPSRLSEISVSEESAYGRIEAWYDGIQMLKSSPLFGVGYNMFTEKRHLTAHNSFVLVVVEEGIVGLFFWIGLIYACFKGLSVLRKKNQQLSNYTIGLEAGLAGFLSSAFFLSRSYQAILYIMLALAASFIYTFLKKEDYAFSLKDIRTTGLLSLGILFICWIAMRISLRLMG